MLLDNLAVLSADNGRALSGTSLENERAVIVLVVIRP